MEKTIFMLKRKLLIIPIVLGVSFTSCKKDEPLPPESTVNDVTVGSLSLGALMTADFFGRVLDENGDGLSNVTVKVGSETATTDLNGVFKISQASVNTDLAYVLAEKNGYFDGSRSLIPSASGYNYIQIKLYERKLTTTFPTGTPMSVYIEPGVNVDFNGLFVDQVGNDYVGYVKAYIKYIEPIDHEDIDAMPGSPFGQSLAGTPKYFESYGQMFVELEGNSGQKIEIARDSYITLRIRTDQSQVAQAPASIPLSAFDHNNGYWVEHATAELVQDEYQGNIGHAGYWNFASVHETFVSTGLMIDYYGDSLVNFPIQVVTPNGKDVFYSASDGSYSQYLPAGFNLIFNAIDGCQNETAVSSTGPFSSGTVNPFNIQIQLGVVDLIQELGSLLDCGGVELTNGYVLVKLGNQTFVQYTPNGKFEVDNINCNGESSYEVLGVDLNTGAVSFPNQQNISNPITSIGDLFVCGTHSEYFTYSIDSGPEVQYFSDIYCAQLDTGGGLFFEIYPMDLSVKIVGSVMANGPYSYFVYLQPGTIWIKPNGMDPLLNFSFGINLVNFGAVGDYVTILYTGTYTDNLMVTHTIEGDLAVKRDF